MSEISRREFLRLAALGAAAVVASTVVEACSRALPRVSPTATRPPLASGSAVASATAAASETLPGSTAVASVMPLPSPAPAGTPDLVVVRNGEPEILVRSAIAALGGMERFVKKGANVVVKPNICVSYRTYEYAATTNPWVVAALVKLAFEAGAGSVKVMDYPFGGTSAEAYKNSGIKKEVEAAGGQMVVMSSRHYVTTRIPSGKWMKETDVYDEILKADVLISAPIAKRHGSGVMTAGMKNMMGIVRDRPGMHGNLGQAIADLNTLIRPHLTVVDAVRILTSHGPTGGDLAYVKKIDTVIAGTDVVAADSYVTTLFGLKPTDIPYLKIGAAMGIGRSDLSTLNIREITV